MYEALLALEKGERNESGLDVPPITLLLGKRIKLKSLTLVIKKIGQKGEY